MQEYEITYLASSQLSDEARSELDAAIDALVDQHGGVISFSEPATRRRLFYPIKKQSVGFARTINITLDPAHLALVREAMSKQAGVLRATTLKTPQRQSATMELFQSLGQPAGSSAPAKREPVVRKAVTMAEVEEKIEEALEEEVK